MIFLVLVVAVYGVDVNENLSGRVVGGFRDSGIDAVDDDAAIPGIVDKRGSC